MNKKDDIIPFTSTIGIVGIITIVYPFLAPFYYGHVIFVVVFGFFVGNCYVVTSSITLQFVDINNMATAIGMQFLFFGIGAVLGPILAGVVVDAGGSYDLSVISAGICIILATVVGVMSTCFKNRTKRIMDIEVIPPKEELNDMNSGCDTHG
ncbi:hypothetical protein DPMN_052632 [Dreissena polymorpha]|uniref:Major facilitator superfamily (MFS) profile domain-containing protein n=2 Tax=Dreissena polymorpha TaxID=45954 RepID=A0A9D4HRG4_DREPO|nr:hypothetical protein DPMN_052632 [Dreissena polymorpha]